MRLGSSVLGAIVVLAFGSLALAAAAKGDAIGTMRFADAEGRTIALDTPGVVYLVDFWALACKPCIEEMPELERLAKEYEPAGKFRLVTVVWGFEGKDLLKLAERAGATVPMYSDPEDWYGQLGVNSFPTKFYVRDGTVLDRHRGGGAGTYQFWKRALEHELKAAEAVKAP